MDAGTERLIGELIANVQNVGVQLTDWRAEFNRIEGRQDERIAQNDKRITSLETSRSSLTNLVKFIAGVWSVTIAAIGIYLAAHHP